MNSDRNEPTLPPCPKSGYPDKWCPICTNPPKGISLGFAHALVYAGTRK